MRSPTSPPPFEQAFVEALASERGRELLLQGPLADAYLHWDELRHREPPEGVTLTVWWALLRMRRRLTAWPVPHFSDRFACNLPDEALELLRRVDQGCGVQVGVVASGRRFRDRPTFLAKAQQEEAVQSSLLEGAATTRLEAMEMLRIARAPRTEGERMVHNSYAGLSWVREHLREPLTPAGLCELHRVLTVDTLPDALVGRVQTSAEERIAVVDRVTGGTLHRPPPAQKLPELLEALCALANGADDGWHHPIVRACLVHFALAWMHPFADGNGRLARALFYLVALREGYWPVEYLPISRRFRDAPTQYARAFLLTESDGGDVTYFLLHHLRVLSSALDDFHAYAERKEAEVRQAERQLANQGELNPRQLALLRHALRHPRQVYTIKSHQNSHGVAYATARADLLDLAERGLLAQGKSGRAMVFLPAKKLEAYRAGARGDGVQRG